MSNNYPIVITTQWNSMHVIVILKRPPNPLNTIISWFNETRKAEHKQNEKDQPRAESGAGNGQCTRPIIGIFPSTCYGI